MNVLSNWIDTGNLYADEMLFKRFMDDTVFQALIEYLAVKGVLNKVEFATFLNERCRATVAATETVAQEARREQR